MKLMEAEIFDIRFDPSVSPTPAIQMGKRLEEPRPFFYEEPVDAMNVECMKKVAAHAETYDLHMQPHNSGGVVATACAVQLDCCILNFNIQEWFPYPGEGLYRPVDRALEPRVVDGYLPVPRDPGLGIELDAAAAARQTCVRVRQEGPASGRPSSAAPGLGCMEASTGPNPELRLEPSEHAPATKRVLIHRQLKP